MALVASFGGLAVSAIVGRRLVVLEVENQRVEATLRTKLVMLEQSPVSVVGAAQRAPDLDAAVCVEDEFLDVSRTAQNQRPRSVSPVPMFKKVQKKLWDNYLNLFANFAMFNTWISLYDQTMVILPYVLLGPLMFSKEPSDRITLGTLMQATNSFDKVFGAMSVVTQNWDSVNAFRSTVVRLRQFEKHTYTRKSYDHRRLRDLPEATEATEATELAAVAPCSTADESQPHPQITGN